MVQCFNAEDRRTYIHKLEKVKFGVSIDDAFTHDIPATLLVLLLKINKQGPLKKDIWRAPGNQSHVRKLINIMQNGRLVNIDNYSVYTAASVIKKFLCKIPSGIFGIENETKLFSILAKSDNDIQRSSYCRIVSTLSVASQHLLILLVGTFSCIVEAAELYNTRMTPDALGVSVAPSIFHSCIHDRNRVKVEDVMRFRDASHIVAFMIRNFGRTNLFPRENYEFYARITGRTLRVDENYQFSFQYPAGRDLSSLTSRQGSQMDSCCCYAHPSSNARQSLNDNLVVCRLHNSLHCSFSHTNNSKLSANDPLHSDFYSSLNNDSTLRHILDNFDRRTFLAEPYLDESLKFGGVATTWRSYIGASLAATLETTTAASPPSRSRSSPTRVASLDDLLRVSRALMPLLRAGDGGASTAAASGDFPGLGCVDAGKASSCEF